MNGNNTSVPALVSVKSWPSGQCGSDDLFSPITIWFQVWANVKLLTKGLCLHCKLGKSLYKGDNTKRPSQSSVIQYVLHFTFATVVNFCSYYLWSRSPLILFWRHIRITSLPLDLLDEIIFIFILGHICKEPFLTLRRYNCIYSLTYYVIIPFGFNYYYLF